MTWKEYDLQNRTVADWLPWGGIVDPCIVRNKDDSFFGIIEYQPYPEAAQDIVLPEFRNGWSIWNEHQHGFTPAGTSNRYFLVLCWNPFLDGQKRIINPLGPKKIVEDRDKREFRRALDLVARAVQQVTTCHLLGYQEIINFLTFTLSMGEEHVEMPDVPLYLDALLSQDLDIDFSGNNIFLNDKEILVFSLPAMVDDTQQIIIDNSFQKIPYRHTQRLLLMSEKSARKNLKEYISRWCDGRKSVRKLITDGLIGKINGYYSDSYFLLIPKERREDIDRYTRNILDILHISYRMEQYNLKDVWWGSLPGIFRANITPPQTGFSGLGEILYHPQLESASEPEAAPEEKGAREEVVQAEPLPSE